MSEGNLKLVRRIIERFNAGDLESELPEFSPGIEWHDLRELPGATVHHGAEATLEHLRDTVDTLADYHLQADELIDAQTAVVVCGRVSASGQSSAVPVERPFFALFTVTDGLAERVEVFGSRAEIVEAAGLPG